MRMLLWLPLALLLLPLAGILYQRLGARRDRRRVLQRYRLVHLGGGHRICIQVQGDSAPGAPTIVFEFGIAATSQNWTALQREASRFARTVSYDRLGLGWSSAAPSDRTPGNIALELDALLRQTGIAPPYILVAHSFGGLVARRFAAEFPADVAGLVLIDSMRCEDWPPCNASQQRTLERSFRLVRIGSFLAHTGIARLAMTSLLCRSGRASRVLGRASRGGRHLLDRIVCEVGKMPPETRPVLAAHWSSPHFYRGLAAYLDSIPLAIAEMQHAPPLAGIPIIHLTAGNAQPLSEEALQQLGPHARQVLAADSGHWIHLDQPALVLDAIRSLIRSE